MKSTLLPAALAALSVGCLAPSVATSDEGDALLVSTASRAGIYFRVGQAMCRTLNTDPDYSGPRCVSRTSDGSIQNLRDLRGGHIHIGVVQSDWQFHAVNGSDLFAPAGPDENLRALFSVHGEPFTLVARRDSGITAFADLPGKRVNIGNPGSGQRGTMEALMAMAGWTRATFSLANELPADQQSLALCHDRVQAMVYTVGHPNDSVEQAVQLCDAQIVPVEGMAVTRLIEGRPYYAMTEVPGGIYPGNPDPIPTFGVLATVVTRADVDDDLVYAVTRSVFENFEDFRRVHAAFQFLEPARMVVDGLSAPIHDGAMRYYREAGLLP